ncbi:MAG TPA: SusC/RagA family TonB-linked outer membrane protein, partial [Fibrella sp.]
ATGEGLAGASVSVRGTTGGTNTDSAGAFTINVPATATTLSVSYVGFAAQEVVVSPEQTNLIITLQPSGATLDQVVVVGYGTQRRRDLTGSVASVRGAELAKQPVQTATQAVQGRVAGVQVITSGQPNALPTVRVRGTGTMLGGAEPLYVVDGVITTDIRNINTSDIVSMDILKDASATAIYGMRAANGVLLITTKKGRTGRLQIAYDANVGIREATNLVDMAGPAQYANYLNEASVYYGSGDSLVPSSRLAGGQHTDWYDAILRRGFQQNHNVSLSGGSESITYFFSAGYLSDEGILQTNKLDRFTLRSNNEYKLSKMLTLSSLVSYAHTRLRNANLGVFNDAYRAAPYVPAKVGNRYGNTSEAGNVGNPLLQLEKADNRLLGNRLQGTFALDFKPIKDLTLRSSMGIDLEFNRSTAYGYQFFSDTNTFITPGGNQQVGRSSLGISNNEATRWVWDNTATYSRRFNNHNLTVLAGVTAEAYRFNELFGQRFDVPANRDQWF